MTCGNAGSRGFLHVLRTPARRGGVHAPHTIGVRGVLPSRGDCAHLRSTDTSGSQRNLKETMYNFPDAETTLFGPDRVVGTREAARLLAISDSTLEKWCAAAATRASLAADRGRLDADLEFKLRYRDSLLGLPAHLRYSFPERGENFWLTWPVRLILRRYAKIRDVPGHDQQQR